MFDWLFICLFLNTFDFNAFTLNFKALFVEKIRPFVICICFVFFIFVYYKTYTITTLVDIACFFTKYITFFWLLFTKKPL